jgi:hypothetical protein
MKWKRRRGGEIYAGYEPGGNSLFFFFPPLFRKKKEK